jgi:hypothetical protein
MDKNAKANTNTRKVQLTWKDVEGEKKSKNNSRLNAESFARSSQNTEQK